MNTEYSAGYLHYPAFMPAGVAFGSPWSLGFCDAECRL